MKPVPAEWILHIFSPCEQTRTGKKGPRRQTQSTAVEEFGISVALFTSLYTVIFYDRKGRSQENKSKARKKETLSAVSE